MNDTAIPSPRSWLVAACVLAVVILIGCLPLVTGRAVPLWDAGDYFGPLFSLIADHAKAGRLMLWDPWINAGSPDFAEPQVGAASPVLLAFALLSPNPFHGFVAYWLAIWIFGAVGMLLLCRHLGAPPWGALVVALGFAACGVYTSNAEHTSWVYSFSFVPWIAWRFDRGLLERRYLFVMQAAVLWGLSAQGGYPGVTIADVIFLTLWAAGRTWVDSGVTGTTASGIPLLRNRRMSEAPGLLRARTPGSVERRTLFLTTALLLVIAIGVAIMSPAYVSFQRENRGYTVRAASLERQFSLSSGVLAPGAFATLASPYLYRLQQPDQHYIWPETDVSMNNLYMGVLVTVLALGALARPTRWRMWLLLMAVFFACCAVGSHLPVRGWLYDFVPPTRYFRMPSLFRMYVIVSACVLAAYGTRDLEIDAHNRRPLLFVLTALLAVAALLAYTATVHSVQQNVARAAYPLFHLLFTWSAAALLFLLVWRGALSKRSLACCLIALAGFDAISTLRVCRPTIYSVERAPHWKAMERLHVASLNLLPRGLSRGYLPPESVEATDNDRNVALKVACFRNRTPLKNSYFQHYLDDPALNRIAMGDQRIWFSDHPLWVTPSDDGFAEFARASRALANPPLLLHSPAEMTGPASASRDAAAFIHSAPAMVAAPVELVAYLPNTLKFRYRAANDGWLLVTDRWANAWTATVNGKPQAIAGGDFLFRAVPVTRGDNLVEFRYRPRGYVPLVALSWSVVLLAVLWQVRVVLRQGC